MPHLREINRKFPKLRIVLEHCTTAAAVEAVSFSCSRCHPLDGPGTDSSGPFVDALLQVKSLPPNVVATITPHHLALTIDGACSTSLGFCKPLAKFPSDRAALRAVVRDGNPKFFLGSDSAPHPSSSKLPALQVAQIQATDGTTVDEVTLPSPCAAGIYTSSHLVPLTAELFERAQIPLERLEGFCSRFGREFYGFPARAGDEVTLRRAGGDGQVVDKAFRFTTDKGEDEFVIPFLAGERIGWEIAA